MDKLENFMNGFAAAVQLKTRAGENGFFIEYVCLATTVIDAMLRIGIILNHQLKNKSMDIIDELLFQSDEDKIIFEREIYRRAFSERIITKNLFNELENLYIKRNRILHRYIISDITTKQVLKVGLAYEQLFPLIEDKVRELEIKQIELGVGMTEGSDEKEIQIKSQIEKMIAKKHKDVILNHALKKK